MIEEMAAKRAAAADAEANAKLAQAATSAVNADKAKPEPKKIDVGAVAAMGVAFGAIGALMQQQGDLRDRMLGFGKGALIGGLTVMAVKTGLGV
jgi:hypothetical protein